MRPRLLSCLLVASLMVVAVASGAQEPPAVTISMILDGPWDRNDEVIRLFQQEILDLLEGEFEVKIV